MLAVRRRCQPPAKSEVRGRVYLRNIGRHCIGRADSSLSAEAFGLATRTGEARRMNGKLRKDFRTVRDACLHKQPPQQTAVPRGLRRICGEQSHSIFNHELGRLGGYKGVYVD